MATRTAWQQSLDTLLAEMKKAMNTDKDVILLVGETTMSVDKWSSDGCPHTVKLMESKMVDGHYYRVFLDTGYGRVILVKGADALCRVSHGKHMAELDGVIAMDIEYYGLTKWLWE